MPGGYRTACTAVRSARAPRLAGGLRDGSFVLLWRIDVGSTTCPTALSAVRFDGLLDNYLAGMVR